MEAVYDRLYDERPESLERVSAVPGDVSVDGLALSPSDRDELLDRVTSIIHCAASISFDLPLETARQTNSVGPVRMLELARQIAERGHLHRHVHVSTAYVAGRYHGHFREPISTSARAFATPTSRPSSPVEQAVAAAAGDLPLVVARPSIIVGDSRTGWTPVFNVIYWPLRAFSRGLMDEVPVDPDGVADIVPIDYVAEGLLALLDLDDVRGTVHLVAGASAITNRS